MCLYNTLIYNILIPIPKDICNIIISYLYDINDVNICNIKILLSNNKNYLQIYKNRNEFLYISNLVIIYKILKYIYYNNVYSSYKITYYEHIEYFNKVFNKNYYTKKSNINILNLFDIKHKDNIIKCKFIKKLTNCYYKNCSFCFNKYIRYIYDIIKLYKNDSITVLKHL